MHLHSIKTANNHRTFNTRSTHVTHMNSKTTYYSKHVLTILAIRLHTLKNLRLSARQSVAVKKLEIFLRCKMSCGVKEVGETHCCRSECEESSSSSPAVLRSSRLFQCIRKSHPVDYLQCFPEYPISVTLRCPLLSYGYNYKAPCARLG